MKVRAPDGTVYEFPDDTKDSEITSFFEAQGAPPEPATPPPAFEPLPATALAVPGGVGAIPAVTMGEFPEAEARPESGLLRPMRFGERLGTKLQGLPVVGKLFEPTKLPYQVEEERLGYIPPETYLEAAGMGARNVGAPLLTPENFGIMVGAGGVSKLLPRIGPRAVGGYFGYTGIKGAIEGATRVFQPGLTGPERLQAGIEAGGSGLIGLAGAKQAIRPRAHLTPEEIEYAIRQQEAAEVHGDLRTPPGEGAQIVSPEIRGEGVRPEAAQLGEEAQVLLKQAGESNKSLGLGGEFQILDNFGQRDPEFLNLARAESARVDADGNFLAPGRIFVNRASLELMMRDTPPEQLAGVLQSVLAEEGIHALTTPGEAAVYGQTLTRAELAIGRRLYLRGLTEKQVGVPPDYLPMELLRRRVQQLMGLKTTELADAVGREKWSVRSLEVIANIIRRFREIIGTKAAKAGQTFAQNILDRAEANLKTAMEAAKAAERAEPRRGAAAVPEEPSPFEEGVPAAPSDIDPTTGQPYGGEEPFALRRRREEQVPPVVRSVPQGAIPPESIVPAIRLIGGEVVSGKVGETHPDIIKRENLKAVDIDQRGFSDPTGKAFFLDREAAAQGTAIPTEREPGRLHSTDLNREGEAIPEAPAALRRQHDQDMDFARRLLKMDMAQFMKEGTAFNRINLRLGENATWEDVAELHDLRQQSMFAVEDARKEYEARPTEENKTKYVTAMQKPQFYNEALKKHYEVMQGFEPQALDPQTGQPLSATESLINRLGPSALRRKRERWWYSRLERAVETFPAGAKEPKTGQQWKGWIDRMAAGQAVPTVGKKTWRGGIAKEEIDWSGIKDLLEDGKKYTRQQVAEAIRAQTPDIREVPYGAAVAEQRHAEIIRVRADRSEVQKQIMAKVQNNPEFARYRELRAQSVALNQKILQPETPGKEVLMRKRQVMEDELDAIRDELLSDELQRLEGLNVRLNELEEGIDPQYPEWQLSGGVDYSELLFTMPQARGMSYQSEHWGPENVIAHVRFNERYDSWGRKVLFLEEAQSDLHQQGRKYGYRRERRTSEIPAPEIISTFGGYEIRIGGQVARIVPEMMKPREAAIIDNLNGTFTAKAKGVTVIFREEADAVRWVKEQDPSAATTVGEPKGFMVEIGGEENFYQDLQRAKEAAIEQLRDQWLAGTGGGAVPDFPFKDAGWKKLILRRMLFWAAENGFDGIGWTTGAQQLERYNIGRHINRLAWNWNPERGMVSLVGYDHQGNLRVSREVPPEQLADWIGEETAKKITESEQYQRAQTGEKLSAYGDLSGLDLRIGGEGMTGFYDREMPNLANDIGKKFGQRTATTYLEETQAGVEAAEETAAPVHFFEIPDQMRETVQQEGFPLLALRRRRGKGEPGPDLPMGRIFGGALTQPERKPAAEALAEYEARAHEPVTIAAVQSEADTYFGQTTAPSLKDFAGKLSVRFGAIKPGEARSQFEEGFWRWAERAPGTEVSAMARDLGLAKRLRLESPEGVLRKLADPPPVEPQLEFSTAPTRAKPQVPGITRPHFTLPGRGLYGPYDKPFRGGTPRGTRLLESPAQRLRAQTLATIADKLMTDAEGGRSFLKRSEIDASEDLGDPKIQTKQPVYHEIGIAAQADPVELGRILTEDARAFGGEKVKRVIGGKPVTVRKKGFPVSASKRLTVVQHKKTGKVSLVSTYRDGRRGPVMVDPGVPGSDTHTTVAAMLNRFRVIASALLDEPVQDFRKDYKSLSEYQADFGKPARAAAERSLEYELPPEVTEPEVTKVAPPEAVTPDEASSIIDQVVGKVDKVRSPEDVKLAWESLKDDPASRSAIMGLRKLGREILRQNPDIGEGAFLDKLAQQIYENHTKAQSLEEFQRLTMEQSRPPVSEAARLAEARRLTSAQAAEALRPPPKVTGARELTAQPRPEPIPTAPRPEPVGERAPVNPLLTPKERDYVEFEYLRTHPKTPQEYAKMARLYGLEKPEGPAALRRAHSLLDETRRIREGLVGMYKGREIKRELPRMLDVAENVSHDLAFRDENYIRGATRKKQKGLFYGNREVLAASNALIAADAIVPQYNWTPGLRNILRSLMNGHPGTPHARKLMKSINPAEVQQGRAMFARIRKESIQNMIEKQQLPALAPTYTFDPAALAALDVFDLQVQTGLRRAEAVARRGGWKNKAKAYAWRKAAEDLAAELKYARDHWGDAELTETAIRARQTLDGRYDTERNAGYRVKYDTAYVPGRYDAEFFNDNAVLFGKPSPRVLGKLWRKKKTFRNYYEAIADTDGPYIAMTRDIANIVGHRVRQGEKLLQYKQWQMSLLNYKEPVSGKPLAIKMKKTPTGFVSPDPAYEPVTMRSGHDPIAVHEDWKDFVERLTGPSHVQNWAPSRFVLEWGQRLKHTILMGDFFHLSRLFYYSLSIMGTKAGFRRGLTALEFHERDIPEAVRNGIISQKEANWATEKIPVHFGNLVQRMSRVEILREFENTGLNVGRIQDAIYKDLVKSIPGFGRYNKWLFDRYTRGLMAQSAIVEFERQHKANPAIPPHKLMRDIARDTNQYFGSIGRQGWLTSKTWQDISRMAFLAPQWVEGLVDKEIVSAARLAGTPLHLMGLYRDNLNPLGTMGRGIGRGLVTMLALTQVLNLMSKGKPTWENEKGHKWDAWIPTVDGEGLWLSPLAVFNELTHDLIRLGHSKRRFQDAITQIGSNKLSPWGRLAIVLYTGLTPTKEYIPTTGEVWGTAAAQLIPVPISFGKLGQAALHPAMPGLVPPTPPGAVERQMAATLGLKTEPAAQPALLVTRMAEDFVEKEYGKPETIKILPTTEPSYSKLRNALRVNDFAAAKRILKVLEKTRTDRDIDDAMKLWSRRTFTGSKQYEGEFVASLKPDELLLYDKAVEQKEAEYEKFVNWFSKQQ